MVRVAAQGIDVYRRRRDAAVIKVDAHASACFFGVDLPYSQRFEYRFEFRIQVFSNSRYFPAIFSSRPGTNLKRWVSA